MIFDILLKIRIKYCYKNKCCNYVTKNDIMFIKNNKKIKILL